MNYFRNSNVETHVFDVADHEIWQVASSLSAQSDILKFLTTSNPKMIKFGINVDVWPFTIALEQTVKALE